MIEFALALVLVLGLNSPGQLAAAREAALRGDHDVSQMILAGFTPSDAEYSEYQYYRLVNSYRLNQRAAAEAELRRLESTAVPMPRRHAALVGMIREDMKHWKDGDMADISRDMSNVGDRLRNARGGPVTQATQKVVIEKLDRLIKEQEDKANGGGMAGADGEGKMPMPGDGSGPAAPMPAQDSKLMGGSGPGRVDQRKLREAAENWGTLPPDRRAALVQELTRDLPPRYKPMIDEYFRSLNRLHGVRP